MSFVEVEFPTAISFKAMGGPRFLTTVNSGISGFEQRNQNWAQARGKWNVSLTTPSKETGGWTTMQQYIDQLQAMFLVVGGRANGFRLKDHKDFDNGSAPQFVGIGDGATSQFQLLKTYSAGGKSYIRAITKPVTSKVVDYLGASLADSVAVLVGGVPLAFNAGYLGGAGKFTLDETTGIINFGAASKLAITAVTVNGPTATYTYTVTAGQAPTVNQQINVAGMAHAQNDGAVIVTETGPGTFSINNPTAIAESASSGVGLVDVSQVAITAASQSGSVTTYTYTLVAGAALAAGMRVTVVGMAHAGNNVAIYVSTLGSGTFSGQNAGGVTESGSSGTGLADFVPAPSAVITATYEFHFPVRFDTDDLDIQIEDSDVEGGNPIVSWNSIELVELRLSGGQG